MSNFQEGQEVELLAGYYRRKDGSVIMRGQRLVLTEEEANRSDANVIFGEPDGELEAAEDTDANTAIDYSNPVYDTLYDALARLNVKRAKEMLSSDQWDADGMRVALEAEKNGKDRDSVVAFIEGRILDLEDEGFNDESEE